MSVAREMGWCALLRVTRPPCPAPGDDTANRSVGPRCRKWKKREEGGCFNTRLAVVFMKGIWKYNDVYGGEKKDRE